MYGLGVAAIAALAAIAVMWTRPQPPDPGARHRDTPKADVLPADAAAPATAPPSLPVARSNGTRPLRPTRAATPARATPADAVVVWRDSRSIGLPWAGRLLGGVHLPAEGRTFFTWDPILRRSPNRPWRRFGSDRLVRVLLRVAADYRRAHPNAPRVAIGDLSRPRGGGFGRRFGGLGHVSHQNGLDADIYYPRLDRRELAPRSPRQIDRRLAQDLVNRFVRAGARFVFVGPRTGLVGPQGVVQRLVHHDDHMHVRIYPARGARPARNRPR